MGPGAWFNPLRAQILVHKMGLTMVTPLFVWKSKWVNTGTHSSVWHTISAQYC